MNQSGKVACYSRKKSNVVVDYYKPQNTAYEKNLYTLKSLGPNNQYILENTMAKHIDNPCAPILRKLINLDQLTNEERRAWTIFLVTQRLRSPCYVSLMRNRASITIQGVVEDVANDNRCERYSFVGIDSAVDKMFARAFLNLSVDPKICSIIFHMNWAVYRTNSDSLDFLISDTPILMGDISHGDTTIILPLSSNCVFIASHIPQIVVNETVFIRDVNKTSVRHATLRVWATGAQHRKLVEKWLRTPPH